MNMQLKKIYLTICSFIIGTALFAQQQKTNDPTRIMQNASEKATFLKQQLSLTAEQEKVISELTRNVAFMSSEGQQSQAWLDEYFDNNMIPILDTKQLEKYTNLKKEKLKVGTPIVKENSTPAKSKSDKSNNTDSLKK